MSDSICAIRPSRRAWLPDVLTATTITGTVALALLAAACGGGGSPVPPAGAPGPSPATGQALAYARCMRSHGVSDFPDPSPPGSGGLFSLGSMDVHSAQFQSADRTCQKQTGFGHFSAAQLQQAMTALLEYAGCMRARDNQLPGPVRQQPANGLQHHRYRHELSEVQGRQQDLPAAHAA